MMKVLKRIMNSLVKSGMDKKKENRDRTFGITLIAIILIVLLSSCVTTQNTTHNCELMKNGQKCLPDHSCCK